MIVKCGIDVVRGCQLRCLGCPEGQNKRPISFMTQETWEACLRNIDTDYIQLLRLFNFGEPLLHPNLPALLERIPWQLWRVGCVEISTNAQPPIEARLLEDVLRVGVVNQLVVSCDGDGTANDYERLRPPSRWTALLRFLKGARDIRDAIAPSVKLLTRTICTDPEGQATWRELLEPLGWTPGFRAMGPLPDSAFEHRAVPGKGACQYIRWPHLYVDYDGTAVPCCIHPRAFVLGNLTEQPYSEIAEERRRAERLMARKRSLFRVCRRCER